MQIGVPKEIKVGEYRVGLTPQAACVLVSEGHQVYVESGAGEGIQQTNKHYRAVGASIVASAAEVYQQADLIVKVKDPEISECAMLRPGQLLFSFLHLAPNRPLTNALIDSGASCFAYETLVGKAGDLPLLAPMSDIAGRVAVQAGAHHLQKHQQGAGILLGGATGVAPAKVVVLGGGVAGSSAAAVALGMGAEVEVLDLSEPRLADLRQRFYQLGERLNCQLSTDEAIHQQALEADLLIGCVLVPGASAPKLVAEATVKAMKPGSVIVDIAIDQGGCIATSRPTTHQQPTFLAHDVVHYCVTNIPGAVPTTASYALSAATLPYVRALASQSAAIACRADKGLLQALNICGGAVCHTSVAEALGERAVDPLQLLGG